MLVVAPSLQKTSYIRKILPLQRRIFLGLPLSSQTSLLAYFQIFVNAMQLRKHEIKTHMKKYISQWNLTSPRILNRELFPHPFDPQTSTFTPDSTLKENYHRRLIGETDQRPCAFPFRSMPRAPT